MPLKRLLAFIVAIAFSFTMLFGFTGCGNNNENKEKGTISEENTVASDNSKEASTKSTASTSTVMPQTTTDASISTQTSTDAGNDIGKPAFVSEKERKSINLEFKHTSYETKVQPYVIKSDLSNIENLKQFGSLTAAQRKMLAKNGFVVTPTDQQQLFYIYENNEYLKLPSFVTTDSVLQAYHIFYDYSLRTLEYEKLLSSIEQLTDHMLNKSIAVYNKVQTKEVKAAALKNIAFFAVAQQALEKELPTGIPKEAVSMANEEYKKIKAHEGFSESSIFPFKLDFSQYVPRGHYTRNHDLERYFVSMMWYGQVPMPLVKKQNDQLQFVDETIQALLMTYTMFLSTGQTPDIELWESVYDPTSFYVGSSDDLNLYQYADLLVKVYGKDPDIESFADTNKMNELYNESLKLPEPEIKAKWVLRLHGVDTPVDKQLRFMGQRYIPDSEMLQKLVEPIERPFPKGLDVMGVLGSSRAYDILINTYKTDKEWSDYPAAFTAVKDKFNKLPEEKWRSNMYYGWLWVLKSFTNTFGKGYPSFMTNQAWRDKSLSTALGSWAELRHDTILYGKQSGAECGGGGEETPVIKSYVEPSIEVYEKLLWLTQYSKKNLASRGILPEGMEYKIQNFEDLLQFLIDCSKKELRNEELTREEYDKLLIYGGTLEGITSSLAGDGVRWFEITSETDKNMAIIADVHTTPGWYLEEGVGTAAQIYTVVPIGGKLYITTGAVFDYYEFEHDKRLTDEEWQKILKNNTQPPSPEWTKSFRVETKQKPDNQETIPYSSGC